jgi:hypothetical protein
MFSTSLVFSSAFVAFRMSERKDIRIRSKPSRLNASERMALTIHVSHLAIDAKQILARLQICIQSELSVSTSLLTLSASPQQLAYVYSDASLLQ